jgi:hypothetical protein
LGVTSQQHPIPGIACWAGDPVAKGGQLLAEALDFLACDFRVGGLFQLGNLFLEFAEDRRLVVGVCH